MGTQLSRTQENVVLGNGKVVNPRFYSLVEWLGLLWEVCIMKSTINLVDTELIYNPGHYDLRGEGPQ